MNGLRLILCNVLLTITVLAEAASPEAVYADKGMVTSRSELASMAGVEMLRRGGNAIDAAVATGFALAVTYPSAGNIGGGGFAVIRLEDGRVLTLDHREKAPMAAHRDMYLDESGNVIRGLSTDSHRAAGVPGSVDGLLTMLEAHGSLPRKTVMAPAISLARHGFPLSFDLARQLRGVLPAMARYPASVEKFSSRGEPFEAGEVWRQPDLARTLQRVARHGRAGFYAGKVGELIVAEMRRGGGDITLADLAAYESVWRPPVSGTYRGYEIWAMGPPSSGGVLVIAMLNMLEPFDLGAMGWGSADVIHHMVEAERRAYADRAEYLGDPDFFEVPVETLISKEYARHRFADFDPARASSSEQIGPRLADYGQESRETTHFSVMDADGVMVALTTTLNSGYGNKIVVPGTGILLNNEMNDFSVKPDTPNQYQLIGREANAIEPGKRMLSSMSPTIVTRNGEPFLATGSPGGSTIITTTLQVIINVIDHDMGIDDAVALPRFHHQWRPDQIRHDPYAISPDTEARLRRMGHDNISEIRWGRGIGDANSIMVKDGVIHGMKDPRNEGGAIAY
ncbi:MAG: gamma-glutamyltransferase [Proteobacteria bacterium]|nr:gamma-glutamyltransferase [Pseudomonadota bacterium]